MAKGVFIVGTDTDVGKTVVSAGFVHVLRSNGYHACYFKAALSGALQVGAELIPGDTKLVCDVGQLHENYENMTPFVYRTAVSPHLAAKIENKPINIDVVLKKFAYLRDHYDYIIAEGSGGIICPLIDDERGLYTLEHLIRDLHMSVIIVAKATLGTINHTVLTVKYIESIGIPIQGIMINNYEDHTICDDNIKMIEKLTNVPIIATLKKIESLDENFVEAIQENAEQAFAIERILDCMRPI